MKMLKTPMGYNRGLSHGCLDDRNLNKATNTQWPNADSLAWLGIAWLYLCFAVPISSHFQVPSSAKMQDLPHFFQGPCFIDWILCQELRSGGSSKAKHAAMPLQMSSNFHIIVCHVM